jgi:glycerol uptake facilitator-like aquaporin
MDNSQIPEEYRPISMWGYFGYEILFSIPVIGFIFLLIFALGAKNVNKKNFARSYFCYTIICLVIFVIIFAIAMMTGATANLAEVLGG